MQKKAYIPIPTSAIIITDSTFICLAPLFYMLLYTIYSYLSSDERNKPLIK